MKLLLDDHALAQRRVIARTSLVSLAQSLAADLAPLLDRDLYIPAEKALLSRDGGRCARDGTLLEFDPFQPHEHRCPRCGTVYRGELHDRFWIYWYQLWLAERALHASLLAALGVDERFASLAHAILEGYVERYDGYPNVDNVLGPTRLFFSTYLESIWLLQIVLATDALATHHSALAGRVIDRIIEPSRAIISTYDEGMSNRQVWNDVALLAASRLLDDERGVERAMYGESGILAHLGGGLLADGTWYEGENYHLFAHRGLWYGVTMAERAGLEVPLVLIDRFERGFTAPFATALPDFTLPSRRDSQYAISLRQWRIAEHCELGLARRDDPVLAGALARMYAADVPQGDTGRSRSSADVERNETPSRLTRADLSWRALLCARSELPSLEPHSPSSMLLDSQGIAVFRRERGRVYAALDYGQSGGGHGHHDRLNLLLMDGATRWLDDYGTGSYVDPSLHWYRSTLAHNAPLVDGRSQRRVDGSLLAYEERGAAGWIVASAEHVAPNVGARRTLVALSEYLIDIVEWRAGRPVQFDLPFHADLTFDVLPFTLAAPLRGGAEMPDGFTYLSNTEYQSVAAGAVAHGVARSGRHTLDLWTQIDHPAEWWRAVAPGPPGAGDRPFRVLRASGTTGRCISILGLNDAIASVQIDTNETIHVSLRDGSVHSHRRTDSGWHIDLLAGSARSSIDLAGFVEAEAPDLSPTVDLTRLDDRDDVIDLSFSRDKTGEAVFDLGEPHYRRSEQSWLEAGRPTARVTLSRIGSAVTIAIDVPRSDRTFTAVDAANRYDNEHPDVNGDGVQLHVATEQGVGGWMLVPETHSSAVRVRAIGAPAVSVPPSAQWRATADGYRIEIHLGFTPAALDVIVNEMPSGRTRRRGQLVLSGAAGEFVYLRGDRHDPSRLLLVRPSNV